jgi:hypothetical protein
MHATTLDLKKIARELDGHFDQHAADETEGQCRCGEWVTQFRDTCPLGHPIIWRGSKAWNEKFLGPRDRITTHLFRTAGTSKFRSGAEYHKWRTITRSLDEETIKNVIAGCRATLRGKGSFSGRALIRYTLNTLALKVEKEPEQEDDDRPNVYQLD